VTGAEDEAVETPDRDALARAHIAKGFRAMRQEAFDEARQEFEQARELARDPALVHMAQARLDELSIKEAEPPRIEEVEPPRLKEAEPPRPREETPARRLRRRPQVPPPAPPPPPLPAETLDWIAAARIGLLLGIANGVLTGCGAIFCVGCVFAPLFGFIAGWQVASQRAEPVPASHALIAGAVTGLIGWFGQVIGYLGWLNAISETFTSDFQCLTCFAGGVYIVLTVSLSALGWKIKTSRDEK
jgi:hypothetical protein